MKVWKNSYPPFPPFFMKYFPIFTPFLQLLISKTCDWVKIKYKESKKKKSERYTYGNSSIIHNDNPVAVDDCIQSVGYGQYGTVGKPFPQCILDDSVGTEENKSEHLGEYYLLYTYS